LTNLFAWLRTHWIVAIISLSEPFIIQHLILIVLPYLYRKCTTGQGLVFLIQRVETYLHYDILFLEQGTCTRFLELLLKRLPVFRQSVHFPQTMHPCL
jgi:hypothetical protein